MDLRQLSFEASLRTASTAGAGSAAAGDRSSSRKRRWKDTPPPPPPADGSSTIINDDDMAIILPEGKNDDDGGDVNIDIFDRGQSQQQQQHQILQEQKRKQDDNFVEEVVEVEVVEEEGRRGLQQQEDFVSNNNNGGGSGGGDGGVLTSLPAIDDFLFEFHQNVPENVTSRNNRAVDELDVSGLYTSGIMDIGDEEDGDPPLSVVFPTMYTCHIVHMLGITPKPAPVSTYEDIAAVALALQHLNTGDGSVVPELDDLDLSCPVRFSLELMDTRSEAGPATDGVSEITNRRPSEIREDDQTGDEVLIQQACAFIGAGTSMITGPTALLTGYRGLTQVSPYSTATTLDDKTQYPLFGRTVPNDDALALTIVEFFRDVFPLQYLALLTSNDAYGISFGSSLQSAASRYTKMTVQRFTMNEDQADIERVLTDISNSQYRYVIAVMTGVDVHNRVMSTAYKYGMAGNGLYAWFFPDSFQNILQDKAYEADSDLAAAYQGAGMFLASGSIGGGMNPTYDRFLEAMKQIRNPYDLSYLSSLIPEEQTEAPTEVPLPDEEMNVTSVSELNNLTDTPSTFFRPASEVSRYDWQGGEGFFVLRNGDLLDPVSSERTTFAYDATILLGLAACDALNRTQGSFTGTRHYNRMRNTRFDGVTGSVRLDSETGSRLPNSTLYQLVNFVGREEIITTERNGTTVTTRVVIFDRSTSQIYDEGNWTQIAPFVFNDGSTTPPAELPPVDENFKYISNFVRGASYTMFAICILSALALMVWTWKYRNARAVRASQPFFLYLINIGVIITAGAIVTQVFDTSVASQQACSIACTAGVWLLSIGCNVIFSALFTKTYRINKIMKNARRFRKVKITVRETLIPMVASLIVNISVLIAMTVMGSVVYVRTDLAFDQFGRTTESFGHCEYGEKKWYMIPIAFINVGFLFCSIYQAYAARHLSTEFSESKYIFKALLIMMLTIAIGVPVVALSYETPSAVAFISSAMITVVCMSVLAYIFWPKVAFVRKQQKGDGSPTGPIVTGVSGFNAPDGRKDTSTASVPENDRHGYDLGWTPSNRRSSSGTDLGERIVTTKTAPQLAAIIHLLEKKLEEKDRLLKECEEKCSEDKQNDKGVVANNENKNDTDESGIKPAQPKCDERKSSQWTALINSGNDTLDNEEHLDP